MYLNELCARGYTVPSYAKFNITFYT